MTVDAGCFGLQCLTGGGTGGALGTGGGNAGTGGGAATGGGTAVGGGTGTGGGAATGGGGGTAVVPTTIQEARAATFPTKVDLQGVVVTAVSFARASASATNCVAHSADGGTTKGVNASFWVADPNNAQHGVWVEKFRCDENPDYFPHVGDVLNVSGIIGMESYFQQQDGYRVMVKSEFDYISGKPGGYVCALTSTPPCEPLVIAQTGNMAPLPAVSVPNTFGNGGTLKAEPTYVGARIKIEGPLTLANATPEALRRVSALPGDNRYFGFELSNGVLVNNFKTFDGADQEDGGKAHCDVRLTVLDGGTVAFPNGIAGVWDTYTHASCADGGTSLNSCFNNKGTVPGTPDASFTHVLYPTSCDDLLQ